MTHLVADEGNMYTNGEIHGETVCLPDGADVSTWSQVPKDAIPEDGGPLRYSVVRIIEAMRALGKYERFREWLEDEKVDWDFIGANYLSANHQTFRSMCTALMSEGIIGKEEFDDLLKKCFWTAD